MRKLGGFWALIQELCPKGVDYRLLWEGTVWDKKFSSVEKYKQKKVQKYQYYLASDRKALVCSGGDVKILTTNVTDLWADEKEVGDTLSAGEVVCIPWGGNPVVQYYKGRFITGDNRIATPIDPFVLNNKYLYYCLQHRLREIASFCCN